jgi:hypothetical protein
MAKRGLGRPRTLSVAFGLLFLVVILGMASFAFALKGVWYDAGISRWLYFVYLLAGTVFLVGLGGGAIASQRALDSRIARMESAQRQEVVVVEDTMIESDEVPPPLPPEGENVDRDIDELLVSLQEMEEHAGVAVEESNGPAPTVMRQETVGVRPIDAAKLERLRRARNGVGKYIAGPAAASILIVALCAMMLPGTDAFLQSFYQLNAFLVLTIAYSFGILAAYVAASFYLLLRRGA